MQAKVFVEATVVRVLSPVAVLFAVALPSSLLVLAIDQSYIPGLFLALGIQLLLLPGAISGVFHATRVADRITVTEAAITGRPLVGRRVEMRWEDIDEIREFVVSDVGGKRKQTRLFSGDRRRIAIDGRLPHFDELMEVINIKAPDARRTTDQRSWWRRQLLPG